MLIKHYDMNAAWCNMMSHYTVPYPVLDRYLIWHPEKSISSQMPKLNPEHSLVLQESTHTRLTALCPGLPGWAGTRKVNPIWILLKQETVSGSGISWAICKSASRSRHITMLVPCYSRSFTGRMLFLPPNQQRQSTGYYLCSAALTKAMD